MKKILLWDPRFPDRQPARLTLDDAVASAAVRAGVAAAVDPAEQGALAVGAALDPGTLVQISLAHGLQAQLRRVFVPLSVAQVAVTAGVAAGVGQVVGGGTPTPSLKPMIAVTNQRFPDAVSNLAVGESFKARSVHQFGYATDSFTVLLPTSMRSAGSPYAEVAFTGQFTTQHAVEMNGVAVRTKFSGANSVVLIGGQAFTESDPFTPAMFGLTSIARDRQVFQRVLGTNTGSVTATLPNGLPYGYFGSIYAEYPSTAAPVDDVLAIGAMSTTGGSASALGFPMFIKATPLSAGAESVAQIGDSITAGFAESWNNGSQVASGYGYFNRALLDTSGANAIAGINFSRATSRSDQWLASHAAQDAFLALTNVMGFAHGTNDFASGGSAITTSTMQQRAADVVAAVKAVGGAQRVYGVTLPPRGDTGDAATPNAGWGAGSNSDLYNQWVLAYGGGLFDAVLDLRSIVGDTTNPFIWKTSYSGDRLHPLTVGHVAPGTALRSLLLSLTIDGVSPGTPSLGALSLSPATVLAGGAYSGTITGKTSGSAIAASSSDGTTLIVSGTTVSGTFAAAGTPTITLTETLAGAIGSPRGSTSTVTVTAAVTLGTLSLAPSSVNAGTAYSGTITGKTSGSAITATASDGTTLTVSGTSVTGTFAAAGTVTVTLVETLSGATGSPKSSTATITINAAAANFLRDTFTATDGTLLTAHTPETGGSWSRHASTSTVDFNIGSGRVYSAASPVVAINAANPNGSTAANYKVSGIFTSPTIISGRQFFICGRLDSTADTCYLAGRNDNNGRWDLAKRVAGTQTTLGSQTVAITAGDTHTVDLVMNGSAISLVVDGVTVVGPITDTSITAAGFVGARQLNATTATTGTTVTELSAVAL